MTTQHECDSETGYDYRGARNYDSEIGRFLEVDPHAGDYAEWTPFHYVLGNPLNFIDPDGKDVYTVDQKGRVSLHERREDEDHDLLYLRQGDNIIKNHSLRIDDQTLLPQLLNDHSDFVGRYQRTGNKRLVFEMLYFIDAEIIHQGRYTRKQGFPGHYIYHVKSQILYHYRPYVQSEF